jgi:hypothetical protein
MIKNNIEKRMKQEIRSRMESRSWDLGIAGSVIEKKRKKKSIFLFSASVSSLVTASLIIYIVLFGIGDRSIDKNYTNFISTQLKGTYEKVFDDGSKAVSDPDKKKSFVAKQVHGTHNAVFKSTVSTETWNNGTADFLSSDIDSMIDNTMAQR